jgi:hypothetical protein
MHDNVKTSNVTPRRTRDSREAVRAPQAIRKRLTDQYRAAAASDFTPPNERPGQEQHSEIGKADTDGSGIRLP